MNILFSYASSSDLKNTSQYSRLQEFYKLDSEIKEYYENLLDAYLSGESKQSPYRDLKLALMFTRAKYILRSLDLIN